MERDPRAAPDHDRSRHPPFSPAGRHTLLAMGSSQISKASQLTANQPSQWHSPQAVSVPRNQLQPGDLVFFNGLDHVGIYIGNGYLIDAPHTGADVRIDNLREGWYAARYDGAKRIVGAQVGGVPQAGATMTFASGSGGTTFTSDVVYFTH